MYIRIWSSNKILININRVFPKQQSVIGHLSGQIVCLSDNTEVRSDRFCV